MALKVTYKGTDIIDETTDCVKKLDTTGCYMEDDVTIEYSGGGASTDRAGELVAGTITGKVTVPSGTTIRRAMFMGCSGITEVVLPSSITTIDISAFQNCSGLTSLPNIDNVTSLGASAFYGCTTLTSAHFPQGMTTTGNNSVFSACSGLTSAVLHEGLVTISADTFRYCSSLTHIVFPSTLTTIQGSAFNSCSSMVEFDCTKLTATGGSVNTALANFSAFNNTGSAVFKFSDESTMNAYKIATNWSNYASRMTYVGA